MPEGPLGGPRLTNIGPLSRKTKEEIEKEWDECNGNPVCEEVKIASIAILENQGFFADFKDIPDINGGACGQVARHVNREIDGVTVYRAGDGDHFWIEKDGLHYDAEVPTGVEDMFELPIFHRADPMFMLENYNLAYREDKSNPRDMVVDVTDEF